jgi:hypothetical protein
MMNQLPRRSLLIALMLSLLVGPAPTALAGSVHRVTGGGTASISQVAMGVSIDDTGLASGSFECLMAGRSGFALAPFGLSHIMAVHATPTVGSVSGSVARFAGPALLIMDNGQSMDVHVQVWVDSATQKFQLTVVEVGALPTEDLLTGQISLR